MEPVGRDCVGRVALALLLACVLQVELGSETLTLTAAYPSPAGVYVRIVTTGGSLASPQHTVLNRDAGNVGIGTTNPGAMLEVGGSIGIANTGKIRWRDTSGNLTDVISWSGDTLFIRNSASNPIVLTGQQLIFTTVNSDVERLRVTSLGDVGIGTSSPGARLEVVGQVKITGGSPGLGKALTSSADGTASWQLPALSGSYLGGCAASESTLCTCGAGELIMLLQAHAGGGCFVQNQNTAAVRGWASAGATCEFACFR